MEANRESREQEQWTLRVRLKQDADQIPEGTELVYAWEGNRKAVSVYKTQRMYSIELGTDAADKPLLLETEAAPGLRELEVVWLGYRVELWADEELKDEEWPDGVCLKTEEPPVFDCMEKFVQTQWQALVRVREPEYRRIDDIQYWAPELGRHNVGDCMPFSDRGVYHLFYLKDRHQHKSKWGKGAHQFAHISTTDLVHWQEHPVAVGITHQWEGSICTGSVIRAGETYYAFYAVRMTDGSSARVSYATSKDCIYFTKSERYFTLTPPYETTSVRDPEVFFGADGKYHMLLTTDWEEGAVRERSGCLAHMVSDNLTDWEQKEPFLIPGYTDQPECCDYFEWNGWYYLIFSNYGTAKYRYSRQPFGPWSCPQQEMIDGLLYRVPKTADFHGRRIASGFLCINTEGNSYAGSLVLRELKQNADGTLSSCFVKEYQNGVNQSGVSTGTAVDSGEVGGYRQEALAVTGGGLKVRITNRSEAGSYGLILSAQDRHPREIRIDPVQRTVGVYEAHSCLYHNPTKRLLTGVEGLNEGCTLEIILRRDILDICVNETRTLICRLEESWPDSGVEWSCYVKDGRAEFERVKEADTCPGRSV